MSLFQIESKAGVVFGVYEGETPEEAFAAMVAEAGGVVGDEPTGVPSDWIIREVGGVTVELDGQ